MQQQATTMKKLFSWDTVYSADSVEWCPIHPYQDILACGTYQIQPSDEEGAQQNYRRLGCLYLFRVSLSGLNLVEQHEMPAVLDLKWCHVVVYGKVLLAIANARGEVLIYELSKALCGEGGDRCTNMLNLVSKKSFCDKVGAGETLMLSLDWSVARKSVVGGSEIMNSVMLVVSDSRGWITALQLTESDLVTVHSWKAHDYEAWIAAFNYWNTFIIYSGGDDSKLHVFDQRIGTHSPVQSSSVHEAGVTSLHCSAVTENWLVSGSYDEKLRSWDTRSFKNPITTTLLGGGVWRLKWDPHHWRNLLAACMNNGFQVVTCPDRVQQPKIVAEYQEHESLAYGTDWCHLSVEDLCHNQNDNQNPHPKDAIYVATCSFYDHKLHISYISDLPW